VCAQPIPLSVRSGRNVADVQSPNSCLCSSNEGRETTPSVVSNEQIGVPSPNDPIHSIDSGRETTPSVVSNEQTVYVPVQPTSLSMNTVDVTDFLSPDGSVYSSDSGIFSGSSCVSGD